MAVEIKRKSNENSYSFLRRFKDKVKKGRVLALSKNNNYFQKKKSKRDQKEEAKKRQYNRERRAFQIKTGQIEENDFGQGRQGKNGKFKK